MRRSAIAAMVLATTTAFGVRGTAGEQNESAPDALLKVQVMLPSETQDWEPSSGVEIQARLWQGERFATALTMGFQSWIAKNEYSEMQDDLGTISSTIYGNATLLPIGLSALFRNRVGRDVSMVVEAGVRYVFIDSKVYAEVRSTDETEDSYVKQAMEIDPAFIGVLGIAFESELADGLAFHLGLSYQFDLNKPQERFMGEDAGESSLRGPSVNIGVSWKF